MVAVRRKVKCTACDLHRTCASPNIGGRHIGAEGPVEVMFVGQAPGTREDEIGSCFVGPAGQLLEDLIKETGLNQHSCWLTNVCRCAPPNDAIPNRTQAAACLHYLEEELERHHPKVVVPLGATATLHLTGKKGISRLVGVPAPSGLGGGKWQCFPIYHPSFILHRKSELPKEVALFKALKQHLKGKRKDPRKQTKVYLVDGVFEMKHLFQTRFRGLTAFDYETTGLDPWQDELTMVGMSDKIGEAWVFPITLGWEFKKVFKRWLGDSTVERLAHNAPFELIWSKVKFGIWPSITHDTQRLHHLLDENQSNSLSDLVIEYLPKMAGYDAEMNEWLSQFRSVGEGYATCPQKTLAHYCGQDVDATLRLLNKLHPRLVKGHLDNLYREIVMPTTETIARLKVRGMLFKLSEVELAVRHVDSATQRIKRKLDAHEEVHQVNQRLKNKNFNPNSNKQVRALLFDVMKMQTTKHTHNGNPSVGEEALKLMPKNEFTKMLLQVSELKGRRNVLVQYLNLKREAPDARPGLWWLNSDYNNASIVTGRLSSKRPNLMAIPKDKAVASAFVSRFPGGRLVKADYSQLEIRLLAEMTRDPGWFNGFCHDKEFDPHQDTADALTCPRPIGKRVNFGVVYGIGAQALSEQIPTTKQAAQRLLDAFWTKKPCISDWFADQRFFLRQHGWIASPVRRIRRLPDAKTLPENDYRQWRAMRQGPNFIIQGFAADLMAWTMNRLEISLRGHRALMVNQIHDALIVDTPRTEVGIVSKKIRKVMLEETSERFDLKVPLLIDLVLVKNLGECVEE